MAKEICISSTPHETRLAILEDDQLAEIYYERENEYTLAGSIYNGRVTRVLPGMQSAFVDIGLERDAFLYVTDFMELEDDEETDEIEKAAASGANQPPREVRHAAPEGRNGRSGQKPESKPEPKAEPKQEPRPSAEKPRGFTVEELPVNEAASCPPPVPSPSAIRQTRWNQTLAKPAPSAGEVAAAAVAGVEARRTKNSSRKPLTRLSHRSKRSRRVSRRLHLRFKRRWRRLATAQSRVGRCRRPTLNAFRLRPPFRCAARRVALKVWWPPGCGTAATCNTSSPRRPVLSRPSSPLR